MKAPRCSRRQMLALPLWLAACGRENAADKVPTVVARKKKFARVVDVEGYLKPVQATAIVAPRGTEGPMRIAWLAEDGTTVKKGDVIARFDETDIKSKLRSAEDERATAVAEKQKEAMLLGQARSDRKRTSTSARRELEMSRAFQRKDTTLYSRDDIITSEIDEQLQAAKADHADSAIKVDAQVARRKLQIREVMTKKADEAIARANQGLTQLEARAPHDGVLVFKRSWRGETMGVGDPAWGPIAEVSRSDEMEAEVFVLEVEAAGLSTGRGRPPGEGPGRGPMALEGPAGARPPRTQMPPGHEPTPAAAKGAAPAPTAARAAPTTPTTAAKAATPTPTAAKAPPTTPTTAAKGAAPMPPTAPGGAPPRPPGPPDKPPGPKAPALRAEVVLESQPNMTFAAEVKRVEAVAKRRNPRSPTQYFAVTLTLAKTDAAIMKPGQRVRAKVYLDEREAVVVPRPALFEKDGKPIAYRREGAGFKEIAVKMGASTAGLVAVEEGLADGDVIALRDPGQSLDEILAGQGASATTKTR